MNAIADRDSNGQYIWYMICLAWIYGNRNHDSSGFRSCFCIMLKQTKLAKWSTREFAFCVWYAATTELKHMICEEMPNLKLVSHSCIFCQQTILGNLVYILCTTLLFPFSFIVSDTFPLSSAILNVVDSFVLLN